MALRICIPSGFLEANSKGKRYTLRLEIQAPVPPATPAKQSAQSRKRKAAIIEVESLSSGSDDNELDDVMATTADTPEGLALRYGVKHPDTLAEFALGICVGTTRQAGQG